LVGFSLLTLLPEISLGQILYQTIVFDFVGLLIPLSLGISILCYRLWDIDVVIRRTLQYSLLTGLQALTYFGGVAVLQANLGPLTGSANSPLVIVIATLGIAALFNPLRRRVQDLVNRRFYRRKYNAQQVLAQFAQTARDEVELAELTAVIYTIIQETLQPEGVDIWLKPIAEKP